MTLPRLYLLMVFITRLAKPPVDGEVGNDCGGGGAQGYEYYYRGSEGLP